LRLTCGIGDSPAVRVELRAEEEELVVLLLWERELVKECQEECFVPPLTLAKLWGWVDVHGEDGGGWEPKETAMGEEG
jgi:hypothetical protein